MTINPGPNSHHAVIECCGPNHVLLDGRILVDLEKRSHIWSYFGPTVSTGGPDGRHWYVAGGVQPERRRHAPCPPRGERQSRGGHGQRPGVKPSLRVGMQATVQLELTGPPKDNEAFRKAITDSLNAKLQANAMTPGQGGPVWFIVHVEEKDTGRKVDYREFGDAHFSSPRGSIAITNLVCDVQFADGQGRIPLAPQQTFGMLQGFRRIYRLPAGRDARVVPQEQPVERREDVRQRHRPALLRRPPGRWGRHAAGDERPERGAVDTPGSPQFS